MVNRLAASAGDLRDVSSTPGTGTSPGGGHGNPLQCFCLENPMDRGAQWTIAHMVGKIQTQLKQLSMLAVTLKSEKRDSVHFVK